MYTTTTYRHASLYLCRSISLFMYIIITLKQAKTQHMDRLFCWFYSTVYKYSVRLKFSPFILPLFLIIIKIVQSSFFYKFKSRERTGVSFIVTLHRSCRQQLQLFFSLGIVSVSSHHDGPKVYIIYTTTITNNNRNNNIFFGHLCVVIFEKLGIIIFWVVIHSEIMIMSVFRWCACECCIVLRSNYHMCWWCLCVNSLPTVFFYTMNFVVFLFLLL